jgi:hypothetical protein
MPTLTTVVDAYVATNDCDQSALSRLAFWVGEFGETELTEITPDDVDAAVIPLADRGKLRGGRGLATEKANKPLSGEFQFQAATGSWNNPRHCFFHW